MWHFGVLGRFSPPALRRCRDGTTCRSAKVRRQHRTALYQAECVVERVVRCVVGNHTLGSEPAHRRRRALRRNREHPHHSPSCRPDGHIGPTATGRRCRAIVLSARSRWHEAVGGRALCTRPPQQRGDGSPGFLPLRLRRPETDGPDRSEMSPVAPVQGAARTEW